LAIRKVGDFPKSNAVAHSQPPAGTRFVMPLEAALSAEGGETPAQILGPNGSLHLIPDMPFLDRVVIDPNEILDGRLNLKVLRYVGNLEGAKLNLFRLLRPLDGGAKPVSGRDMEEQPI
jgi:hypothetical protein